MNNSKLVFCILTSVIDFKPRCVVCFGGLASIEFYNLLRTLTTDKDFYIQITPFDSSLPFKFVHDGIYGYNPYHLENNPDIKLPDYICGVLHCMYPNHHEFYLGLETDHTNLSLNYIPIT